MKIQKSGYFLIIVLAFSLSLPISCKKENNRQGGPGYGEMPSGSFKVLELSSQSVITHIDFPATVQGQQVIEIRPKVDGFIEKIYVNEGSVVKKGQLLITISNPQYEQSVRTAEAAVKIAEAEVLTAQMNVNKVKPLVEKDIISKFELQSVEYTLQSKEAILAQAKATLTNARANLDYTIIRSPLDGVIGNIPYKVGALVNSNTALPLTTLSDIGEVHVYFSMNEKLILALNNGNPGASLQEILNGMSAPSLILSDGSVYPVKGRLETASGLVQTGTGSVSLKAVFSNNKGVLRSGASAVIRLPKTTDSAFLVPQSATYEVLDKRFVYALGRNNKIYSQLISSVPSDDGHFFIDTKNLKNGDRIVLNGITQLKDSMQIVPQMVRPDSIYAKLINAESEKK